MITSLELENYKAFGDHVTLPLAPITLIFGENSAGKSSILQMLGLLKQTHENRHAGSILVMRAKNGLVDMGSFREMVFDHDTERTMSVRLDIEMGSETQKDISTNFGEKDRRTRNAFLDNLGKTRLGMEVLVAGGSSKGGPIVEGLNLYVGEPEQLVARFQRSTEEFRIARHGWFSIMEAGREGGPSPHIRISVRDEVRSPSLLKCSWVTRSREFWEGEYRIVEHLLNKSDNETYLNARFPYFAREPYDRFAPPVKGKCTPLHSWFRSKGFFEPTFNLIDFINLVAPSLLDWYLLLDGFLPVQGPYVPEEKDRRLYYRNRGLESATPSCLSTASLALFAGERIGEALNDLFFLGPYRRAPERWYTYGGARPKDVGYGAELLPDYLFCSQETMVEVNRWLKRLGVDYELILKRAELDTVDLFEFRLRDLRRREPVEVGIPDVGFGLSQLLPLVVQSVMPTQRTICVEQPEVHVHPKLQADLGDLLAEAIRPPLLNRFIIETHSEHLILRLQRLVREQKLNPSDLSVLYVTRGPEGALVYSLQVDEEGDFVDEWPDGFFPERLRELR